MSLTHAVIPEASIACTGAPSSPSKPAGNASPSLRMQYRYVIIRVVSCLSPTPLRAADRLDGREHDRQVELNQVDVTDGNRDAASDDCSLVEHTIEKVRQLER